MTFNLIITLYVKLNQCYDSAEQLTYDNVGIKHIVPASPGLVESLVIKKNVADCTLYR